MIYFNPIAHISFFQNSRFYNLAIFNSQQIIYLPLQALCSVFLTVNFQSLHLSMLLCLSHSLSLNFHTFLSVCQIRYLTPKFLFLFYQVS
jgi:hypothetical protein